jgi:hypothetical protein
VASPLLWASDPLTRRSSDKDFWKSVHSSGHDSPADLFKYMRRVVNQSLLSRFLAFRGGVPNEEKGSIVQQLYR